MYYGIRVKKWDIIYIKIQMEPIKENIKVATKLLELLNYLQSFLAMWSSVFFKR